MDHVTKVIAMPLAKEELAEVDKLLGQMEKNARAWRFTRWLLIGCGLLTIGLAVWLFMLGVSILKSAIPVEPSSSVSSVDLLMPMMFCQAYTLGIILGCFGVSVLCSSLVNWNKGRKDGLLIKLVRSYVEGQRPNP
jgi:hypothetical protein